MTKFSLTRSEITECVRGIKPFLPEFERIIDSTVIYGPLRVFETENTTTQALISAVETKLKSKPENILVKDGQEFYTVKAADKRATEIEAILNQTVEFELNPIKKDFVSDTFPKSMSAAVYILWDKLFID